MILSTDDAAVRDLELSWKGPPDSPTPWEARYSAYIGVLVLAPLIGFAVSLLLFPMEWLPWNSLVVIALRGLLGFVVGLTLAILAVRRWGVLVTPTRTPSHHLAVLLAEVFTPRRKTTTTHTLGRSMTSHVCVVTLQRGKHEVPNPEAG